MASLAIKSHQRYAVRDQVKIHKADGGRVGGLMIELSAHGCRISKLGNTEFAQDEAVTISLADRKLPGRVRWSHDGIAGIRLEIPLFARQLADLLARSRPETVVRYA